MKNKALVVIDIQNDITKNYKEIIGNINDAIERAVAKVLEEGYRTIDIMSDGKEQVGTEKMGDLIAGYIE